ncbi:MAG: hypothetical protein JWP07_2930 [Pseudonocardiales bacterium]|nr:hypothetical protein [Pseudonocardiales bacterium]
MGGRALSARPAGLHTRPRLARRVAFEVDAVFTLVTGCVHISAVVTGQGPLFRVVTGFSPLKRSPAGKICPRAANSGETPSTRAVDGGWGLYPQAGGSAIAGLRGLARFWGADPVCGDRGNSGHARRGVRRRWRFAQTIHLDTRNQPADHSPVHRVDGAAEHRPRRPTRRETARPERRSQATHLSRRPQFRQLLLHCTRLEYSDDRSVSRAGDQLAIVSGVWQGDQRAEQIARGRGVRPRRSNFPRVGEAGYWNIQGRLRLRRAGRCRRATGCACPSIGCAHHIRSRCQK